MTGARIQGASGLQARFTTWAARRRYGEPMVGAAAVYANNQRLLRWFTLFDRAVSKPKRVPDRLHKLAELKAATVVDCEFCIDIGSEFARRSGLTDAQLLALHDPEPSGLFDATELVVIAFARGMSLTPPQVDGATVAALHDRFGDAGVLELTYLVAWENLRARLNTALGIGPGGFSEGRVCALPDRAGAPVDA